MFSRPSFLVPAAARDPLHKLADVTKQGDAGIHLFRLRIEIVVDAGPLPPAFDDTCVLQDSQMAGDRRPGEVRLRRNVDDLAATAGILQHDAEQMQPGLVPKGGEHLPAGFELTCQPPDIVKGISIGSSLFRWRLDALIIACRRPACTSVKKIKSLAWVLRKKKNSPSRRQAVFP